MGVGLGLSQGLVAGLVAGCVVVLAVAWHDSRRQAILAGLAARPPLDDADLD